MNDGMAAQQPRRIMQCRRILGGAILAQLCVIIVLHISQYGGSTSMSHSMVITDSLQSFKREESSAPKESSKNNKVVSVDPRSVYTTRDKTSENLWDQSSDLPQWAKDYFQWHKEQMQQLNETTWKDMRFLVMQCLKDDHHCGGTADRLKPVTAMLVMANQTRRVLLIRWERPCKLENFLLPPQGGLDWRVPEWLEPQLPRKPFGTEMNHCLMLARSDKPVALSRYQSWSSGYLWFNEQLNGTGTNYWDMYSYLWHVLFTPVAPIAAQVQESLLTMGLSPGQYVSAHLRALYGIKDRPKSEIFQMATNAISCASQLNPGKPIFFVTDSTEAVGLMETYAKQHSRTIVSLKDDENPLHLEKAENWEDRDPSDYYSTFRDLYLIGLGNCVSYNVGGFGNWGLLISSNSSCGMRYVTGGHRHFLIPCDWKDGEAEASLEETTTIQPVKFQPPMEEAIENG